MNELAYVDWSRAQFALTALYHFIFVPLTLGLSFIVAIMESMYVKTGDKEWLRITKFWLKLFGINFAIGVATGIIMEFEFGTNWANYSWFVGDIFGAPLAIEGIFAFFIEATFFAVMFFGWNRVSKKFHLLSTWLVAFGSNMSALWILIANGWMQHPTGMKFSPDEARMQMQHFFEVALNPVGIIKFLHTVTSAYVGSSIFVIGVCAWFLLRKRHMVMAKKSMMVAASFGLITCAFMLFSGDQSAYLDAKYQPMKLAAMEGLYNGHKNQAITAIGIVNPDKVPGNNNQPAFLARIQIPGVLSVLATRTLHGFVPGVNDLVYGNKEHNIMSVAEKIRRGKIAVSALRDFKIAKQDHNATALRIAREKLNANVNYIGYGYLTNPKQAVPSVPIVFYAFHTMVILGALFVIILISVLYIIMKKKDISKYRKFLWLCMIAVPLALIAIESGWVVAEVGRQPWAIEGLLPVKVAATNLSSSNVKISIILFAVLFTTLLIAELKIMATQIKKGF